MKTVNVKSRTGLFSRPSNGNGDQYSANDRRQREPPTDFEFDIDPECEEECQQEHSSNEPLLNTLLRVPEIDWGVKKSAHRAPTPGNQRLPFTMSPRLCRHRLRRATHCRIRPLTLSDW